MRTELAIRRFARGIPQRTVNSSPQILLNEAWPPESCDLLRSPWESSPSLPFCYTLQQSKTQQGSPGIVIAAIRRRLGSGVLADLRKQIQLYSVLLNLGLLATSAFASLSQAAQAKTTGLL